MSGKIRLLLLAALVLVNFGVAGAHASEKEHGMTKHYEESIFKMTGSGLYGVEMIVPAGELQMGVNEVDIIVHDKNDRDVPGAELTVTPWMPEMGHGVSEKPLVMERGGGVYSVKNVMLIMTGHWELRIHISKEGVEDTVVFDFPEVAAMGHAHVTASPPPSELDLSKSVLSENNVFKVSYTSTRDPLPINRIHSWTLTVATEDGSPVKDARISLVGDMPEHGHGLPTRPEVSEEADAGTYLVEGMKFSMPGWWVVTFHIKAGELEDSASFNLYLR